MYERASPTGRGSTTDGSTAASRTARGAVARSPLILRILGVAVSAVLGVGTFGSLGFALAQLFDDRGLIGDAGPDGLDPLAHLLVGVVLGAVLGAAVAVWVGLRVWQGRWALLLLLLGAAVATALTLALTAA